MHLYYICIVLKFLRLREKWIASFWTAIMLVSLAMTFFHNHDHKTDIEEICLHERTLDHPQSDHQSNDDCHYCFLFFHQITDKLQVFFWESRNQEILFKPLLTTQQTIIYSQERKYSVVQRGPPFFNLFSIVS